MALQGAKNETNMQRRCSIIDLGLPVMFISLGVNKSGQNCYHAMSTVRHELGDIALHNSFHP